MEETVIKTDIEMNMAEVFQRLRSFREELEAFEGALAHATLPRRKKLRRALRRRLR